MTHRPSSTPFQFLRLDHVVLRARNAPALVAFYEEVLGCRIERKLDVGLIQLRAGDALIDVVPADSELGRKGGSPPPVANSGRNMDHFCLTIAPFEPEALRAHLSAHGAPFEFAQQVYGAEGFGPSVYVLDPEGNTVELKGPGVEHDKP